MVSRSGEVDERPHLWVGPNYGQDASVRLLVLALPRVMGRDDLRHIGVGLEARSTGAYVAGTLKHLQFTAVARLVLGRAAPREECEDFWRRVAFLDDTSAIPAHLETLQPDALLALGAEAWAALPPGESDSADASGTAPSPSEPWGAQRRLRHAGGTCRATCTPHPASNGFAFREHTAIVRALVEPEAGRRATF
ncbi:MAG TPA: hypothetical protein VLC09_21525 [Polyangiaceae bacterium]|nr:hypothetical protein [Polyangiaceae bacterium]